MGKIVLYFGLCFGSLLLFGAARELWRLRKESQWPTVTGVVDKCKYFESDESSWIDVRFHYQVAGKVYSDTGIVDADSAAIIPAAFESGAEITVFYDANRPDHAYLEFPGYESPIALAVGGAIVLAICAPFVLYHGLLFFADVMLRKARYHMQAGLEALSEGQDEIDVMRAKGKGIPPELLEREKQVVQQAQTAHKLLKEMEDKRNSLG